HPRRHLYRNDHPQRQHDRRRPARRAGPAGQRPGETMNLTLSRSPEPVTRDETAAVTVHDLTVAYHETPVLWDIDLTIPTGTLTAIIGPNGAGKSTLLKAILGLIPVAAGTIEIFGHTSERQRRLVGYVPQRGSVDWNF